MASSLNLSLFLFLASSLLLQGALAEITCEELPIDRCAFAIASGKRCSLETYKAKEGNLEYQCSTSEVDVKRKTPYVESDRCIRACGCDRKMVGISSDSLFDPLFISKLCSPACHLNCPNIVDLYFNLAAGENAFLPELCKVQRTNPHRAMIELMSSGAAPGPISSVTSLPIGAYEPSPAPAAI